MSKKLLSIFSVTLLTIALVVTGCGTQPSTPTTPSATPTTSGGEIKIGLPLPMTGSEATYGKDMENSIKMAVDENQCQRWSQR